MSTERKQIGGGFIPIAGVFSTTTKTADLGMESKLIAVNRVNILDSRTFNANTETRNSAFGVIASSGIGVLAGEMSAYEDTLLEPIIRAVFAQGASLTASKLVNLKGMSTPRSAPKAVAPADSLVNVVATSPVRKSKNYILKIIFKISAAGSVL